MGVGLPPFQSFLDEHRDDVYRFLLASVGRVEADDCFQDTFLAALRAYPRLRARSNLRAWVLTIAHRKALDAHRSRRRRPQPRELLPEQTAPELNSADPELWQAVRALPTKQQAAVLHRYVNDLAYADVGRVMGCSEDAARRNALEGVRKLREEWTA